MMDELIAKLLIEEMAETIDLLTERIHGEWCIGNSYTHCRGCEDEVLLTIRARTFAAKVIV